MCGETLASAARSSGDIVVTAGRREEKMHEVAVAVHALPRRRAKPRPATSPANARRGAYPAFASGRQSKISEPDVLRRDKRRGMFAHLIGHPMTKFSRRLRSGSG
jgi:hypothetical protein